MSFEFMRISQDGEGRAVFDAQPSGRPPTRFVAITQSAHEVVFENLGHDFPQRVIYRLEAPDRLFARIEGLRNGNLRGVDYPMRRQSCGGVG